MGNKYLDIVKTTYIFCLEFVLVLVKVQFKNS